MLKVVNVTLKDVSGNLKDNLVLSKTRAALKKLPQGMSGCIVTGATGCLRETKVVVLLAGNK